MPLAAGILLLSGIRAQVFNTLLGPHRRSARYRAYSGMGRRHHSFIQYFGPHGWTLRGSRGHGIAFFALLAYLNGQTLVTVLAAAVLGAASGFLRWNFKPAKIFMGDGGAMSWDS